MPHFRAPTPLDLLSSEINIITRPLICVHLRDSILQKVYCFDDVAGRASSTRRWLIPEIQNWTVSMQCWTKLTHSRMVAATRTSEVCKLRDNCNIQFSSFLDQARCVRIICHPNSAKSNGGHETIKLFNSTKCNDISVDVREWRSVSKQVLFS